MELLALCVWTVKLLVLGGGLVLVGGVMLALAPTPFVEELDVKGKSPPFNPWFSLLRGLFSPFKTWMYSANDAEMPPLSLNFRNMGFDPKLIAGLHALRRKSVATVQQKIVTDALESVPFFYLEVVSFAQFIVLMTHSAFPFALLGSVHARTQLRQDKPLNCDDQVSLTVRIAASRPHRRGTEVDFEALAYFEDGFEKGRGAGPVWSNITTVLFFHKQKQEVPQGTKYTPLPDSGSILSEAVPLAFNAGFTYAALCQDYNPIHLWAGTAKLFGFRSAIVHGMCLLEKSLPALLDAAVAMESVTPVTRSSAGETIAKASQGDTQAATAIEHACRPLVDAVATSHASGCAHAGTAAQRRLLDGAPHALPALINVNFRKPVFLPSMPQVNVFPAGPAAVASLAEGWQDSLAAAAAGGAQADVAALTGPAVAYQVTDEKGSVCLYGTLAMGQGT